MRWVAIAAIAVCVAPPTARADRLELHGRVFARQTASRVDATDGGAAPWRWDQDVASARFGVEYRAGRRVKLSLEVEFSDGDARPKDVWVRWRPVRAVAVQAGRFKRPISAVQLAGLWDLPVVERGLLGDLEVSGVRLPVGGRGDGIRVAWTSAVMPVGVEVAAFAPDVSVAPDASRHVPVDPWARVEWRVARGVTWGTSFGLAAFYDKPDRAVNYRHAPVAGVDLAVERGLVRAWVDAIAGIDPLPFALDVATIDLPCAMGGDGSATCPPVELIADRGVFAAVRAVAGARVDPGRGVRAVMPFVSATGVDLNTRFADDEVGQVGGGVAVELGRHLRWQVHAEWTVAAARAPVRDAVRAMVQLGAAF
ncbi:MAG: hypothetical protein D6689_02935 [Deltaproteobacteria bacterium]|nr:MAG: hypothetical protein D6689_02935 [Deltaproteobacteria bacterium]